MVANLQNHLLDLALFIRSDTDPARMAYLATLASRLGFAAVHVEVSEGENLDPESIVRLIAAAEPAMLVVDDGSNAVGIVRSNNLDEIRRVRAELDENEDARPLIVALPVSIGRTINEAVARADREPRFIGAGHPRESGVFGDFEEAQLQVLELARAGCEVLLVDVPDENDVADLLAQVRALVVGATPALFND